MFLQAAFALAPLFPAPTFPAPIAVVQDAAPSLAWGVPEDAFIALHLNDLKGLIANGQKNAWVEFLSDPRWLELDVWSEMGMDFFGLTVAWSLVQPALSECTEAVAWLTEIQQETPNVYLALRTSEEALARLIEMAPEEFTREMVDDVAFLIDNDSAVAWKGGLALIYIGADPKEALPELSATFQTLQNQTTPAGKFETTDLGADRNPEHVELLIDAAAFFELALEEDDSAGEIPEFAMSELMSIDWMYMSIRFGAGQAMDSNFVLPYKEDGFLSKFFAFAGEANLEAFRRVPADAIGAVIGNLDIPGAIQWALEEMIGAEVFAAEELEEGLDEMQGTLGFHLLDDFVNHMTGEILQITFPVDHIDDEMQSMMAFSYGLIVMDVDDDKAVHRALSGLMNVAAEAIAVEKENQPWGTVWYLNLMDIFQVQLGTTSNSMFLSANPGAIEAFVAHGASGKETPSFRTLPGTKAILDSLSGFQIYLYRTAAMFDSITSLMADILDGAGESELDTMQEFFSTVSEIGADHLDGWVGYSASADGRLRLQSIAR